MGEITLSPLLNSETLLLEQQTSMRNNQHNEIIIAAPCNALRGTSMEEEASDFGDGDEFSPSPSPINF